MGMLPNGQTAEVFMGSTRLVLHKDSIGFNSFRLLQFDDDCFYKAWQGDLHEVVLWRATSCVMCLSAPHGEMRDKKKDETCFLHDVRAGIWRRSGTRPEGCGTFAL
jgi:hypothetical protein